MQPIKVESRNYKQLHASPQSGDWRVLGSALGGDRVSGAMPEAAKSAPEQKVAIRPRRKKQREVWTFWRQLRVGVLVIVLLSSIALSQKTNNSVTLSNILWNQMDTIGAQIGLRLHQISLSGQRYASDDDLFNIINQHTGRSLIGINMKQLSDELAKLRWVKSSDIQRKFPDELMVQIVERRPFAVWQVDKAFWLIDELGGKLAEISDAQATKLPKIIGPGAAEQFRVFHAVLDGFGEIKSEIASYSYLGTRRWSLTFTSGLIVDLAAGDERRGLLVLQKLRKDQSIWRTDIRLVDLRLSDRIAIAYGAASGGANGAAGGGREDALNLSVASRQENIASGTLSAADLSLPEYISPTRRMGGAGATIENGQGG